MQPLPRAAPPHALRGSRSLTALLVLGATSASVGLAQDPADLAAREEFFEARIRPVLVEHCYGCHNSAKTARGGLVLDHRAGTREESFSGTAIVPGDPDGSVLLQVIRHELEDLEMPEDGPRLADDVIADFERWIRDGAHDPRDEPPSADELAQVTSWQATLLRRKQWWSLQPIGDPVPPPASDWSDHPVDRFIETELDRRGLARAAAADRRTLIRRLSFALTGLPPEPAEIAAFLEDREPDATERLVDRLLASPHYGERWARHWMDVVRYADSHGSEGDPSIPHAYRYRDYLIRAFNADVPYDQLVREHVAGDLLAEPRIDETLGIDESAIGTAHFRLVFHGFAPTDALDEKVRFVDDQINVFGKAFLAQTISCARCHDHKFDAISQADYYALFGVFGSCRPGMQDVNTPERQALHGESLAALKSEIRGALTDAWTRSSAARRNALTAPAAGAERPDHPQFLLNEMDRRLAEGATFEAAWSATRTEALGAPADRSADVERRWDLTTAEGLREWYPNGNGLAGGNSDAGAFALHPEGEQVLVGIYPAGLYTHLLSTRHRGLLQLARFDVEGEYDVWSRGIGGGGARLRYVVQDYPRQGTVYPIVGLDGGTWSWRRLDLSYWDGDSVHLEAFTNKDAPIEVGRADRSWFGLRDIVLRPKGAGPPDADRDPLGLVRAADEPPRSRDELAVHIATSIQSAVDAWRRDAATDEQALLLDACLRHGLLDNELDELGEAVALVERYRAIEARVPLPTRVPGVLEADAADQPLFVRGDHRQPAESIPRRFLEAIDPAPYATSASGRLELAEDLLRADNPLTARVITNRIWHHLFGRGLVATPDNFGRLGAEPSHPELLDHLATRFVEEGWSIKDMVRFLVTSKTWQLNSTPPPGARAADPENVWLSHAPVRRLDAESIRDALFAATGRLEGRMYGPGFGANSRTPRRSVYVQSRRNSLDAFLGAFDAPVPFAPVGARPATNVPAQSLALLNDPLVWDLAMRWADAATAVRDRAPDARPVAALFEGLIGRTPTANETRALDEYESSSRVAIRRDLERRSALERQIARAQGELGAMLAPVRDELLREATSNGATDGPVPLARWDFRAGIEDTVGDLDGVLHGSARVEGGGLVLDGGGHVSTPPLASELGEKTLEVWVQLANHDQRGGGAITVQDLNGGVFDSIVFGERIARRWIAGSNNFARTEDFGGTDEQLATSEPVQLAIAYDGDGQIRCYRNGEPYGTPYRKAGRATFRAGDSQVLFGLRHGSAAPGRLLQGTLFEARLYDRALSAEEVAASATGSAFVSRAEVLAALDEQQRRMAADLEAAITRGRAELAGMGEAPRERDALARVAHALFNLKEFLYLR